MPAARFDSTGLGCTSENSLAGVPAAASACIAAAVIGILATTGSVTNSGFVIFAAFTASPSSLARPAPKRTVVG